MMVGYRRIAGLAEDQIQCAAETTTRRAQSNSMGVLLIFALSIAPIMRSTGDAQGAPPRRSVKFENPFDTPHRLQPVRSTFEISEDLLPHGTAVTVDALNRSVGLRDEGSGQLVRVQWSDLQARVKEETVRATANYLLDLPAETTRVLKLVGPLDDSQPTLLPISVQPLKRWNAVEVQTGRLAVRLAAEGSTQPPIVKIGRSGQKSGDRIVWRGRAKFINTAQLEN